MWPRCARTFFPFFIPPCSWLASGYAGIHILPTRAGKHSQATAHWNRQPVRENPTESLGAIGPAVGGNLLSAAAGSQGAGGREGGAKRKRATRSWGWSQGPLLNNGPCVYMRRIISDKAILASSLSSCPLVATPPAPLPLLSLCLCTQRPLPRWKAEQIRAGKRVQEGEKLQRKVIRRKQWGLW